MKSDKYLFTAAIISVFYVTAIFFLDKQPEPLLKDWKSILLWITVALNIINISLLMMNLFFMRGKISTGAILLHLAQIGIFFQLSLQIYAIPETSYYLCVSSPPPLYDWLVFTAVHLIKAFDILDITEAYNLIPVQNIKHQDFLSGLPVFSMYLVIALFIVGAIFNIVSSSEKKLNFLKKLSFLLTALLGISLIVLTGFGFKESAGGWYLVPLNNILLTIDIGDAFQIFGDITYPILPSIQTGSKEMSILFASAAIFFRLIFALFIIIMLNNLLSRFSKGGAKSVDELGKIFSSPEYPAEERMLALKEIETFGSFADSAIPYLVKALADSSDEIRNAAGKVLTELDPEWHKNEAALNAISELSKGLASKESSAKIAAANALGEFGAGAKEVISRLVSLLDYDDKDVQIACADALGKIGYEAEEAVPALVNLLFSNDEAVQASAAEALGSIGQTAAIPHLVKLLSNEDKGIRNTAVETLDKIDPEWHQSEIANEAVTEFVKVLKEGLAPERIAAAEVLGVMGKASNQAIPELIRMMIDSDGNVRNAAGEALEKIDPQWQQNENVKNAIPEFVKALIESEKEIRQAAGEALKKIDPKWRQSEEARKALPHFVKTLGHNLNTLRMAAAEAIGEFGHAALKTIPYLVKTLADKDGDVRNAVAKSLEKIDPKWQQSESSRKALPSLVKSLSDSDWKTRCAASGAIGAVGAGAVAAIPYLVKSLIDGDRNVRNEVKAALIKIDPKWQESKGRAVSFLIL